MPIYYMCSDIHNMCTDFKILTCKLLVINVNKSLVFLLFNVLFSVTKWKNYSRAVK